MAVLKNTLLFMLLALFIFISGCAIKSYEETDPGISVASEEAQKKNQAEKNNGNATEIPIDEEKDKEAKEEIDSFYEASDKNTVEEIKTDAKQTDDGPLEDKSQDPEETEDITDEAIEEEKEEAPEAVSPSLELIVSEGPLYTEDKNICYYRVRAVYDGYPDPEIIFSKDDSQGAWGKDIAQVNLKKDEYYELEASAENSAGISTDTVVLEYIEMQDSQTFQESDIDFSDIENVLIDVDLSGQTTTVLYKGSEVKKMTCSGGADESPTPLGSFTTIQKINYAWLPKYSVGVYYIIRFKGSYLFHSVPFDENGNMIMEEYEKLGSPASHGCIRLSVEDARWLYETIPLGVSVSIHN